jgi:glycosyltransferase involved in cell wall biosynthesis
MANSKRLRILLLAPESNPNSITGPLIGYSHGEALARLHAVTLVVNARNEAAIRKANAGFHAIEAVQPTWLNRLYAWAFRRIFKEDRGNLLWTAVRYPLPIAFEWRAWRQLRSRIFGGEYDVVLRILPIVPMMPSLFAYLLRNGPIPFVIGPLNGGVPWPKGFSQLDRQREAAGNWAAGLRGLYRYLPFARSTYAKATAIIAGSSHTCAEFSRYHNKVFFVPGENGLKSSMLNTGPLSLPKTPNELRLIYVGRLVPYKACDLALRGAASVLRAGQAKLIVLGDGPERHRFETLATELGIAHAVTFRGMVSHLETLSALRDSDVLIFPSLREFGGGVVFEALAMGAVPIVADHGGPGDIVRDDVGYRIPLSNEGEMVAQIESVLVRLASDRACLEKLRARCVTYASEHLTWDAKARMVTEILQWAIGGRPRPIMVPPKTVSAA